MPFKNERSPSAPIVYGGVSIDPSDGSVVATNGYFDELYYNGDSFSEIFATRNEINDAQDTRMDRISDSYLKIIKRVRISGVTPNLAGTTVRFFTYSVTLRAGHSYLCIVPSFVMRSSGSTSPTSFLGVRATVTTTDSRPTADHVSYVYMPSTSSIIPGMTFLLDRTTFAGPDITATIKLDMRSSSSVTSMAIDQTGREENFLVIDLGATGGSYGALNLNNVTGDTVEPPVEPDPEPEPTTKTYTGDWYASHYATYSLNSGNNQTSEYPGIIRQGTAVVPRIGMTAFNDTDQYGRTLAHLRGSNVSIKKITVYIGKTYGGHSTDWYYSSGGIGRLYWHGAKTFPSSGVPSRSFLANINDWKNGQERSYSGNATTLANAIKAGTFGGYALSGEGLTGQYTYHGDFPYRMRLRIEYTVTT